MGAHNSAPRFRRARSIATVVFLIAGFFAWTGTASAAPPQPCSTLGGFEIDGDMNANTSNCANGGTDWSNAGASSTTMGGTYSSSDKDPNDPSAWSSAGSNPGKAGFTKVYAKTAVIGGHFDAFVGWTRPQTSGTGAYAIEIDNQASRVGGDGSPQPDRSAGGFIVFVDFNGSSLPTFTQACTFTSVNDYPGTCSSSTAGYLSALNNQPITDLDGNSVDTGGFFEIALDLTQLTGLAPSCPSAASASLYLRSITGTGDKNLKGYVTPFDVQPDSTCVAPPISTTANPGNSTIDGLQVTTPGSTQQDDATVGTAAKPGVGSVKFYLCPPAVVTANNGDCSANGTLVSTKTLNANGQASSDQINGATTPNDNANGTYCWRVEFTPGTGDHNYLAGSHTNSSTECFTVAHASPKISTQIALTGSNPPGLGLTTLGDTATLTNTSGNLNGQTVTFKLYGPYTGTPTCTGTPIFTTTGTLSGGSASTSQTYTPTAAGTYVWVASYGGDQLNDSVTGTCGDANESTTIVAAHIDVTKSAKPAGPVSAGDTIGFDITVSNSGSIPAVNAVVTDPLPKGTDLSWSVDSYPGCAITGAVGNQLLTCNLGTVAGTTTLPAIHVSSPTTAADCGVVSNKASVKTDNGTGGDSDAATVTILCANLTLTKTADSPTVDAGQQIGFTVTAANSSAAGTGIARGVVIDDPLPAGAGVSWSIPAGGPANCAVNGNAPTQVLHCTGVDLPAGQSESVHVVSSTAFASCKAYNNTASLTTTNGGPLTKSASTTVQCPALTLTKTADASTADAGAQIGFTITAQNSAAAGTGTAHGVVINDPLPAGAGINWSLAPGGPANCAINGAAPTQTLNCSAVDLAPGASETVHVISGTSFQSCATLQNTATATASNHPNVTDSASTRVACAKLTLSKVADAPTVDAGDPIGFTITAQNSSDAGTGTAHGVVLDDPLPGGPGINWTVLTGPQGCSIQTNGQTGAQTLHCTAVDLAAGEMKSVHVISQTAFASCAAYANEATLTASNHPKQTADATTTVQCASLTISKTP
ncbi:MAG TPA: hypothetical protein VKB75_09655, partial [Jatrophihabitans sp.]|nr:hypothetical protein [Jatrophihabitans sp.]